MKSWVGKTDRWAVPTRASEFQSWALAVFCNFFNYKSDIFCIYYQVIWLRVDILNKNFAEVGYRVIFKEIGTFHFFKIKKYRKCPALAPLTQNCSRYKYTTIHVLPKQLHTQAGRCLCVHGQKVYNILTGTGARRARTNRRGGGRGRLIEDVRYSAINAFGRWMHSIAQHSAPPFFDLWPRRKIYSFGGNNHHEWNQKLCFKVQPLLVFKAKQSSWIKSKLCLKFQSTTSSSLSTKQSPWIKSKLCFKVSMYSFF